MNMQCPIGGKIKNALEDDKYFEILLGKDEYWIELEKYCERNAFRLWHNRYAVVDSILDWAIWKDDVENVIGRLADAIKKLIEEDPLVALDTLHSYVSITIKDKYTYGIEEEELDINFGLDWLGLFDLIVKSNNVEAVNKYNDEEKKVYFKLLEVLPKYKKEISGVR